MQLDHFITQGGVKLRCGYTTGTCSALGVKACAEMIFTGKVVKKVEILTPYGIRVEVEVEKPWFQKEKGSCSIRKDGGDDIDVTHGAEISVSVILVSEKEISITGDRGVGKVTKKGLDQPVGEYAINSVPRRQIKEVLEEVKEKYQYNGGFHVIISVPEGEKLAQKTFNEKMGIIGGISILGTTGIVQPRSHSALISTIKAELKMHYAMGVREIILTPGNYGAAFIDENSWLKNREVVQISNFLGDTLDFLLEYPFETVLLVGHLGKLVKVAGGIMNTHSRFGDCRVEIFSAYAALCGGSQFLIERLMGSATSEACLDLLDEVGLREEVMKKIVDSSEKHIVRRVQNEINIGFVTFTNGHGMVGISENAEKIIESWKMNQ